MVLGVERIYTFAVDLVFQLSPSYVLELKRIGEWQI